MHLNVSLQNFRCFAAVGPVRVAPVTLLIGENSAGKTSFLAALREMVEAFNRPSGSLFNREPFFLGSFEQIAHYRGGRSGRAKSFSLGVEILAGDEQPDLFSTQRRSSRVSSHKMTFVKGDIQPELCEYSVNSRGVSASFNLSNPKPRISVQASGEAEIVLDPDRAPSSYLVRREVSFLGFYLQDIARRAVVDGGESDNPANVALRSLGTALRSSAQAMNRSVFASAPVRYQPRRVYTPSELTSQNAGEQVPLQMANLKLSSPEGWQSTKTRLNDFGKRSGLFDDIDVKRFGKTTSDPFQIQVRNSGPASNIADVGYGVSQALPLLFPLQEKGGFDFYLLQQPEVHLHPRAQAEFGSLVASLSSENTRSNYVVETHSDYILDRVRTEVRDGLLRPTNVSILLFQRRGLDVSILQMGVDGNGEIVGFPEDYREFFLKEQARVLGI